MVQKKNNSTIHCKQVCKYNMALSKAIVFNGRWGWALQSS